MDLLIYFKCLDYCELRDWASFKISFKINVSILFLLVWNNVVMWPHSTKSCLHRAAWSYVWSPLDFAGFRIICSVHMYLDNGIASFEIAAFKTDQQLSRAPGYFSRKWSCLEYKEKKCCMGYVFQMKIIRYLLDNQIIVDIPSPLWMFLRDQWVEAFLSGPVCFQFMYTYLISTLQNLFISFLNHRSYINSVINTGDFQRRAKMREILLLFQKSTECKNTKHTDGLTADKQTKV